MKSLIFVSLICCYGLVWGASSNNLLISGTLKSFDANKIVLENQKQTITVPKNILAPLVNKNLKVGQPISFVLTKEQYLKVKAQPKK
jgi:hypothetical protein